MILDRQILDPTTVPDQELIVHRGRELEDLREALRLVADSMDSCLVVHGPPGTGKTMVAREVLWRLETDGAIETAYVDCWEHYDGYHTLYEAARRLDIGGILHPNSTPKSDIVDRLSNPPNRRRVVVLDEAEMVTDPGVFETLLSAPKLDVVAIVNDIPELTADLPHDVRQALDFATHLYMGRYPVAELAGILSERVEHGIRGGIVRDRALDAIAERAEGDARLGISVLSELAENAVDDEHDIIEAVDVDPAVARARARLHQRVLGRLTGDQQTLHDIISAAGEISPGALYSQYCEAVDAPKSRKTMQTYLSKMEHYDVVTSEGTSRDRRYRLDDSGYAEPTTF